MGKLQFNTTLPAPTDNTTVDEQSDTNGALVVSLVPGNKGIGTDSGSADGATAGVSLLRSSARGFELNGSTWDRVVKPNAVSRLASSAATNNATSAKASAGNLFTVSVVNTNAAARYLKFYNKASAPAPGTDNALLMWVLQVPASTVNGGLATLDFGARPLYFSTGIAWAMVTGAGDTDNTAVGAGDLIVTNIAYA